MFAATSHRHASLQMRMFIAMSVFIVLASLPLHLFNFKPKNVVQIALPGSQEGRSSRAVYYIYNNSKHHIEFRFQNRKALPLKENIFTSVASITDNNGKTHPVTKIQTRIQGSESNILSVSGTFVLPSPTKKSTASTFPDPEVKITTDQMTLSKSDTNKNAPSTTTAQNKQSSTEVSKSKPAEKQQSSARKKISTSVSAVSFTGMRITIAVSFKNELLATINGTFDKKSRFIENATITYPESTE